MVIRDSHVRVVARVLKNCRQCYDFVIEHALIVFILLLFRWERLWDIWHTIAMAIHAS